MARFLHKKKETIGTAPDILQFTGEKKLEKPILRIIGYDQKGILEERVDTVDELKKKSGEKAGNWINIDGLHDHELMQQLVDSFGISKLIMAQVMDTEHSPGIMETEDAIFISLKMLTYNTEYREVRMEQLSLILTRGILFSFQERKGDFFEALRERVRSMRPRIINSGADYLAFALLDIVIDNYIFLLSKFGEQVEDLDGSELTEGHENKIDMINNLKRELIFFRKNIKPARELLIIFAKMQHRLLSSKTLPYIRDLNTNIGHVSDTLDSYREILSDQLNVYHTTISSRLNDVMKTLTIFSVIFIPLTFIAGIYGTNFAHIPELDYRNSYFIMWAVMIVITIGMLIYFKTKKWF